MRCLAAVLLAACNGGGGGPDGSFEAGEPYCPATCPGDQPVVLELACAPGSPVGVTLSGSCDASTTSGTTVLVTSGSPGTCNVDLTFDGGAPFVTAVTFTLETPTPLPGCPPTCAAITRPNQPWVLVGNPCPSDGGTDAVDP